MARVLTNVSVLGAGSLRCGAAVLAALLSESWAESGELVLSDEHEEALDLFDRLARVIAGYQELEIQIRANSSAREALEAADTVILCFGLGQRKIEFDKWLESNHRSNPVAARCVLLQPYFERINDWLHQTNPSQVINLVAPVEQTARLLAYDAVHVDWPAPLPDAGRVPMAHQVLRWVHGDEPPFEPLKLAENSPVSDALANRLPSENRFDPGALAQWFAALDVSGTRP